VRDKGTGYVASKPRADGRWPASYLHEGRRRYLYGTSKGHARALLAKALADRAAGRLASEDPRMSAFLDRWLDAVRDGSSSKKKRVGPAMRLKYEQVVRLYLVPHLGRLRASQLRPHHLAAMYREIRKARSGGTVANVHRAVSSALNWGVRMDLVSENVASRLPTPDADPERERRALDERELAALISAMRGDRLEAMYWLALGTGLRFGTLAALVWDDLDLDAAAALVDRKARRNGREGILVSSGSKSGTKGYRMALPEVVVLKLREHRVAMMLESPSWRRNLGLVFPNTAGGYLESGNFRLRSWHPLLRRAGLYTERDTLTFHELRNTSATWMVSMGIDPKTAQTRLGHSRSSTTMDLYVRSVKSADVEAAEKIDAFLKKIGQEDDMPKVTDEFAEQLSGG
jgi:integrase